MRIFQLVLAIFLTFVCYGAAAPTDDASMSTTSYDNSDEHHDHNKTKHHHHHGLSKECKELKKLEEIVRILNNATLFAEFEKKHNLTSDEVTKLKDEAQNLTAELTKLESNTTLIEECKKEEEHLKLEHECHKIKELIIIIDIVNNATKLKEFEAKHNFTEVEEQKFLASASNATEKLAKFEQNQTLVMECEKLLNMTIDTSSATPGTVKLSADTTASKWRHSSRTVGSPLTNNSQRERCEHCRAQHRQCGIDCLARVAGARIAWRSSQFRLRLALRWLPRAGVQAMEVVCYECYGRWRILPFIVNRWRGYCGLVDLNSSLFYEGF